MNILYISEQFPWPLHNGGNLRSFYIAQGLSKEHSVTLLAHQPPADAPEAKDALMAFCKDVVTVEEVSAPKRAIANAIGCGVRGMPLWLLKNRSPGILERVRQLTRNKHFDAVHLNMLDAACFANEPCLPELKVFDSHNCLAALADQTSTRHGNTLMRSVFRREARLLGRVEGRVARSVSSTLVCSPEDGQRFQELAGNGTSNSRVRVAVIPNGVDVDEFAGGQSGAEQEEAIVFVGAMDYFPNIQGARWFCEAVWPIVKTELANCKLYLTGKDPTTEVRNLAYENVVVTGRVPDVRPFVDRSRVFVVPLKSGGGTRLKILGAMAAGKPIVSTTVGAEGLGLIDGQHLLIADTPQDFAAAIKRVWHDESFAARLAQNARHEAEQRFSWRGIQDSLLREYDNLVSKR
ncbi:glycosyltransferase [Roseiconus lacunae]|uniref:Glycosyltransferase n=1 Tax=Roseiconus lacunae TaxID=2605694 RepID=A0ABT7PRV4_9BACT|nr:glycosyltransferase [Roseiconus lacunae]MDM4018841.1 glycosyltransferase [Roseiconus lacunae]